jgi:Spy/CpxP family protein refolding chaperone
VTIHPRSFFEPRIEEKEMTVNRKAKIAIGMAAFGLWWSAEWAGLAMPALAEPPTFDVMVPAPPLGGPGGPPPGGPSGPPAMMMFGAEGPGPLLPLILHQAKLTSEQHEKVRKILDADREQLRSLFAQLDRANQQLSSKLFASQDVKLDDLMPEIDRTSALRRQLMEQGVKTTLAVRAVLTPEQLTRVTEVKQKMDKLQAEMRQLMSGTDR